MHYSIGQTTMATRQAIANLYYRSVRVLRPVELGETLSTTTTVLGLKDSSPKGDQHRGKVWLGHRHQQATHGPVVEYERCALVRASRHRAQPGHDDDIPGPSDPMPLSALFGHVPGGTSRPAHLRWEVGDERVDPLRDHIDLAAPFGPADVQSGGRPSRRHETANGGGSCTAATCRVSPRRR